MKSLSSRQEKLLGLFLQHTRLSSSRAHERLVSTGEKASLVTLKRELSALAKNHYLSAEGAGRSTSYTISSLGRVFTPMDPSRYSSIDPDRRHGMSDYNPRLFQALPRELFSPEQLNALHAATITYRERSRDLSNTLRRKELERLIIELSWKSSKIEGNTYSLLDTEKLILENKEARGHDKEEAVMILNHKDAFQFIYQERRLYKSMTRANLEELHRLLTKNLGVSRGMRHKAVGVTGSLYQPLGNRYHIQEAVVSLCKAVLRQRSPYSKALLALLGISYIQPFEDGNKRTSRLMANALLLAHRCAPLSYRSVEESEYRDAMLVFYELNSLVPFRNIFLGQYEFAARHYTVA